LIRVSIKEISTGSTEIFIRAEINGVDTRFTVPIGTSYGELRDYISNMTELGEELPTGWQSDFTI
jgi:hypothetical protein